MLILWVISLGVYTYKDEGGVDVQIYLSDPYKRFGSLTLSFGRLATDHTDPPSTEEIHNIPNQVVETVYELIDDHFKPGEDDGDKFSEDPEWQPDPDPFAGEWTPEKDRLSLQDDPARVMTRPR